MYVTKPCICHKTDRCFFIVSLNKVGLTKRTKMSVQKRRHIQKQAEGDTLYKYVKNKEQCAVNRVIQLMQRCLTDFW